MQATFCVNCGEPLVTNAAFCPNCGTKVEAPSPDQQATQLQPPPPPSLNSTVRANTPPAGSYTAQYGGPPTVLGTPPGADPYASQYAAPPGQVSQYGAPPSSGPQTQYVPPPVYAPGPPLPVTPGGVAPWAQPQKRQGRRNIVVVLLVLVVLVGACGGGLYLLLHKSARPSTGTSSTPGTGSTPGSSSTPGSGSTPVTSGGTQKLDNINRQAIYAGVSVTIISAEQAASEPGVTVIDPDKDGVLKVNASLDNPTTRASGVPFTVVAVNPSGKKFDPSNGPDDTLPGILDAQSKVTGAWYFEVSKTSQITDWKIVIGGSNELPVTIPLTGSFDPTIYQQVSKPINQTVQFDNGSITGTVLKIETSPWNPGYQPPQGMRFLRVYFAATNNTAVSVNVGDGTPPQYLLVYPDGQRKQPEVVYGNPINDILAGGESKTLGFDSWLIPLDQGHYMLVFLNPDGSTAGTVDFGTI